MKKILCCVALLCVSAVCSRAVTYGLTEVSFAGLTKETFSNPYVATPSSYDFGNGMVFNDISGGALINYTSGYGMGNSPFISNGRGGPGDGYLGTNSTPASFSLSFAGGISMFGFSGAESVVDGGSAGRNGILDIQFYNLSDTLIGTFAIDTNGSYAWDQWHGFSSSEAIGKVVFNQIGHSVFDDVTFGGQGGSSTVPDTGTTLALFGGALLGLNFFRRYRVA